MADPLTLISLGGLALLGGEKGFSLIKLKFGKNGNGNGNGNGKSPSLSDIKVALLDSQGHGLTEVKDIIRLSNEPVVGALSEIKQVNQAMLQQMTRMVTLQEVASTGDGRRRAYKRKKV